jgi:hypothetical protein
MFKVSLNATGGTITGDNNYFEEFFISGDDTPNNRYAIELSTERWELSSKPSENVVIWFGKACGFISTWTRCQGAAGKAKAKGKSKAKAKREDLPPALRIPHIQEVVRPDSHYLENMSEFVTAPRRDTPDSATYRDRLSPSALEVDQVREEWPDDGLGKTQLEEEIALDPNFENMKPFTKSAGMEIDDAF